MTPITQVITALPTAPDPATMTPAVFSTTAAASVLAQKAMTPELNTLASQMNVLAGEVNTAAVAAVAASVTAVAAAASATATANVTMWASGTYATGACVWSPITFLTYRRTSTSPGASAVDPSAAPTLWVSLVGGLGVWSRKTTTYTALSGDRIKASTTGGAWSLTFPASPNDGDEIEVQDVDGNFDIANLTILSNGKKVMSFTTSFIVDTKYFHARFVYDTTLGDWRM